MSGDEGLVPDEIIGRGTIRLTNQLSELTKLNDWLKTLARSHDFKPVDRFRYNLVLEEALTNIISYAFEDDREHFIRVIFLLGKDQARFEIRDDGKFFDLGGYPEVDVAKNFAEGKIGGLGIHLIRNYVDSFEYQRLNDRNNLRLIFHL